MRPHPLTAFRHDQALSQEALAEMLGVSRVTVTRWERGTRKIKADKLSVIARKTGIPAGELRPDLARVMEPR